MKNEKIYFLYRWDNLFNCGLIKITDQTKEITKFKSKKGITITSLSHPQWDPYGLVLFVRGYKKEKDENIIQINNIKHYNMIIDSLKEFNDYHNNLKFYHKEFWEDIAFTHDRIKSYDRICKKYHIKELPFHKYFICDEAKSYFDMWNDEKDLYLKRALAIRISNCID